MTKLVKLAIILAVAATTAGSTYAASKSRNALSSPDVRNAYGASWGGPVYQSYDDPAPGDPAKGSIY
jgi:hypothetical protein